MKMKKLPLHLQLTMTVLVVVLVLATSFAGLALWSNKNYYNETTQRLHQELASYIVDHQYEPLIHQGIINHKALKQIAMHTMAINPLVEVYLIGLDGEVLGHALPLETVKLSSVSVEPILQWLAAGSDYTKVVLGDNPRQLNEKQIFSVAPVLDQDVHSGYLYVMLSSGVHESIMDQLDMSYIAKLILAVVVCLVLFTLFISAILLRKLTWPLTKLSQEINNFQQSDWMASTVREQDNQSDIEDLKNNFYAMRSRIISQFDRLQENSLLRRELISNVSHDLRTPLASMQGYIETVLLKRESLTQEEQRKYLSIAHRNSRRLTVLVSELFELSKLEAGQIKTQFEPFSLLELVYDVMQDYELEAQDQGIQISVNAEQKPYSVKADIGLMQRVLQNLIDNALRFTPSGGQVTIQLKGEGDKVCVTVADSGYGIQEKDLPHIFDAYYSIHNNPDSEASQERKQGTGLGLAIVKRILELHDADISVKTGVDIGTNFSFGLTPA